MKRITTRAQVTILSASCLQQQHTGADEFAAKAAAEHGLDQAEVNILLDEPRYKQSIEAARTSPAAGKPWLENRTIFKAIHFEAPPASPVRFRAERHSTLESPSNHRIDCFTP